MSSWTALTPHPPVATTTVHIKKKAGAGGNDANLSSEERAKREADAAARVAGIEALLRDQACLLYTSPSPRDKRQSRMPSSA